MTKSAVSYLHMYVRTGDKRQDRLRDPASWLPLAAGKSLRNRASVCFLMFVVEPMFGCLPRRRSGAAGLSMNDAVLAHVGVSQKSRGVTSGERGRAFVRRVLYSSGQPFECWPRRVPFSQQNGGRVYSVAVVVSATADEERENGKAISHPSRPPSSSSFFHLFIRFPFILCKKRVETKTLQYGTVLDLSPVARRRVLE